METHTIQYWIDYYGTQSIELVALPAHEEVTISSPFFIRRSYEVYQWLKNRKQAGNGFEIVHFPDWEGPGYYSLVAKHDGLDFQDTILSVGLHGPFRWVVSANNVKETNIDNGDNSSTPQPQHHGECLTETDQLEVDFMERRSIEMADLVFAPSQYLTNWVISQVCSRETSSSSLKINEIPTDLSIFVGMETTP